MWLWIQHAFINLGAALGLLIVVAVWAFIAFVVVDELIGLFVDDNTENSEDKDYDEYQ